MNKKKGLSYKTRFILWLILGGIVIVVCIINCFAPDNHLSIARRFKYIVLIVGTYISALSYNYAKWKGDKDK